MSLCTDPECSGADWQPHSHLSMPDPCPHVSRMQIIAARMADRYDGEVSELDALLTHIANCH